METAEKVGDKLAQLFQSFNRLGQEA